MKTYLAPILLLALLSSAADSAAVPLDHREVDATLNAPYRGDGGVRPDARTCTLSFEYPGLQLARADAWQLELLAPSGRQVARWQGQLTLSGQPADVPVRWQGSLAGRPAAPGIYRVRLHARVDGEDVEQDWEIAVGKPPAPVLPSFAPLPAREAPLEHRATGLAPAPGALPYTVYYGNLHSQSNHSDGGGPLDNCKGAQDPQSAPFGPGAAYAYARRRVGGREGPTAGIHRIPINWVTRRAGVLHRRGPGIESWTKCRLR